VLVAVGIFWLWRATQPRVYLIPVSVADIPAGTVLRASMFKPVQWSNLDAETLDRFITADEWETKAVDGKVTLTEVRAGYPLAEAQIDPESNAESETRLSVIISGTKTSYAVIPVTPDSIGNFVQPGDRVDVLLALGALSTEDLTIGPDGELLREDKSKGTTGGAGEFKEALVPPLHKLIMQNLKVLRVDREVPRDQQNGQAQANSDAERQQRETQRRTAEVKRIYVEVTRDQLEVLSFSLNNGARNISVRAATADGVIEPTEGVSWNDFIRWFYTQRNKQIQADSFRSASPYQPAAVQAPQQ
jgi:Flp pilus assembly protein CpaB